jgi:hypothetical protein
VRTSSISRRKFLQSCAIASAATFIDQSDEAQISSSSDGLEIRVVPSAISADIHAPIALTLYNSDEIHLKGQLNLTCDGGLVEPAAVPYDLPPSAFMFVFASVAFSSTASRAILTCQAGSAKAQVVIRHGLDLTCLQWKRKFLPASVAIDPRMASPELDDSSWPALRIPQLWNENDNAWCRVHVDIPNEWKNQPLHVYLGAVDDNEITYWNGVEIGHTNGWDTVRDYIVPENLIEYGKSNLLTVMVQNPTSGGGMYKPPYILYTGQSGWETVQKQQKVKTIPRPKPGPVGLPHPMRPITVKNGVLRYPEGTEVALWGTNYYPMAWTQFVNMEKTGVDMKATIRQDLDHMLEMGVEIIRIHVFDREISDGAGNLRANIHLDLLDYLVSECSKRGIYFYFTLIAWWGSPNALPDSFSNVTSKPGMMFVPAAKKASGNFIRQFLSHTNPYTHKMQKTDPPVCFLEVMNEPAYFTYADIAGSAYAPQGETAEVLDRDHQIFRQLWEQWLDKYKLVDDPAYFPLFRYELMRKYIGEMISAIRSVNARQPIAISYFGDTDDDITQAIADSECDAVTVSAYPGGWSQVNDGIDLLPSVGPLQIDPRLAKKARAAYEFDAPATNTSCYLYPALAAHFRSGECQIACQFQYDTIATARWNTDWNAHWLNLLYTPTKAVSYMVAGKAFRMLHRGIVYKPGEDHLVIGPIAVSFKYNISLLMTAKEAYYSRSMTDKWVPLPLPKMPSVIAGTGSSPYIDYDGTGLYKMEAVSPGIYKVTIHPDAYLVGNCLTGSFTNPVGMLETNWRNFKLRAPEWKNARFFRIDAKKAIPAKMINGGCLVWPGTYRVEIPQMRNKGKS